MLLGHSMLDQVLQRAPESSGLIILSKFPVGTLKKKNSSYSLQAAIRMYINTCPYPPYIDLYVLIYNHPTGE